MSPSVSAHRERYRFRRPAEEPERAQDRLHRHHIFGTYLRENGITHKLTKPYHPWTNGQAERMTRTIEDVTLKVFDYPYIESLKAHVLAFVKTYNFAKHLKALR